MPLNKSGNCQVALKVDHLGFWSNVGFYLDVRPDKVDSITVDDDSAGFRHGVVDSNHLPVVDDHAGRFNVVGCVTADAGC